MNAVSIEQDKLISVAEAAELLGCTVRRVLQLIDDGIVQAEKLHPKAWVVSRRSVEKYAKTEQTTGRPRISKKTG